MNSDPEHKDAGRDTPSPELSAEPSTNWHSVFLGPHGVRPGWRAAMYVALVLLFMFVLQGLTLAFHSGILAQGLGPLQLFAQETVQAASSIAAALVMARIESRQFGDYGLPGRGAFGVRFWQGVVWGIGEITALILLIRVFGGYSFGGWALGRSEAIHYALSWGAVFLMVGVSEEFFFRGYLQFTAASGIGFWPAAILLSGIFGAVHLRNPGEGPVGGLGVFLIAMFYCLTLRRTGTLWFAVGAHAAFDFGETYLYSVPNSGLVLPGHLLAASLRGPAWLSGGSIGPEGSVWSFVVLGAMFVLFDRVYRPVRNVESPAAS